MKQRRLRDRIESARLDLAACAGGTIPAGETKRRPVASFWNYLSSRTDLLPIPANFRPSPVREESQPFSFEIVCSFIEQQFRMPLGELFLEIDPCPAATSFVYQTHRAQLRDGRIGSIHVSHPLMTDAIVADCEILPFLRDELLEMGWTSRAIDTAMQAYPRAISRDADFETIAGSLLLLENEKKDSQKKAFKAFGYPSLRPDYRAPGVLVVEETERETIVDVRAHVLRAGHFWFRQVLDGCIFPIAAGRMSDTGSIWHGPRSFGAITEEDIGVFTRYLGSAANDEAVRACSALLQCMIEGPGCCRHDSLALEFRQMVPFRDSGGQENDLAEALFLQWRAATRAGCRPKPWLEDFYRGTASLVAQTRAIDPSRDLLREVLDSARSAEFFDLLGSGRFVADFRRGIEKNAIAMLELPNRLEDLLDLASPATLLGKPEVTERRATGGEHNFWAAVILFVSTCLVVRCVVPALWVEKSLWAAVVVAIAMGIARPAPRRQEDKGWVNSRN